jgi:signal transduction histidine kinase
MFRREGKVRHLLETGAAIRNDGGGAVERIGTLRDITARRRAEAALRKSEDSLAGTVQDIDERERTENALKEALDLLDQARTLAKLDFWTWDAAANKSISPVRNKDLLSTWPDEATGLSDRQYVERFVHPEDRDRVAKVYVEAARPPYTRYEIEYRLVRPGGEVRLIYEIGEPKSDAAGRLVGTFGTMQDITDRKHIEEALRRSEARYREFFEESPVASWEEDWSGVKAFIDGLSRQGVSDVAAHLRAHPEDLRAAFAGLRIGPVNKAAVEAYHLPDASAAQLLGSTELWTAEETDTWIQMADVLARGGSLFSGETTERAYDGTSIETSFSAVLLPEHHQDWKRILLSVVDISDRKRAEREILRLNAELEQRVEARTAELHAAQEELVRQERLAALGQLTGTVSHELRNPLGAMRNAVTALKKLAPADQALMARSVAVVDRCVTRCDNIISDLLDYSKARPLHLESTPIDIWLAQILDEYEVPSGISLVRKLESGVALACDRDRLRRVLINLLDNACQAIQGNAEEVPAGEHVLSVSARQAAGCVEIAVRDSGPGIAADDLERIFEPLYSTKAFGMGLGLSIVKRIVEQHDGEIDVTCEPGRGAEFVFRLPLARPAAKVAS